jgi:hypothetical protein
MQSQTPLLSIWPHFQNEHQNQMTFRYPAVIFEAITPITRVVILVIGPEGKSAVVKESTESDSWLYGHGKNPPPLDATRDCAFRVPVRPQINKPSTGVELFRQTLHAAGVGGDDH